MEQEEKDQPADFSKVSNRAFTDKEEASPESQPETAIEAVTPSTDGAETTEEEVVEEVQPEKPLPFHEHPRWIKLQEEKEALAQRVDELSTKVTTPAQSEVTLPDWYVTQYGDTPETRNAWVQAQKYETEREERIIQKAKEAIKQEQTAEQTRVETFKQTITQAVTDLRATGKTFDEDKLLGIVDEFTPKNPQGQYIAPLLDLEKAYEIYELRNSKPATKAKKVAALSAVSSTGAEPTEVDTGKGWYGWKDKI